MSDGKIFAEDVEDLFVPEEPPVKAVNDVIGQKGKCYVCGKEATIAAIDFIPIKGPQTRGECCYR